MEWAGNVARMGWNRIIVQCYKAEGILNQDHSDEVDSDDEIILK